MDEHDGSQPSLARALPGLARLAAGAGWRTAEWTAQTSLRASARVARAAMSGESAAQLLGDARAELRDNARRLLGVADVEERVRALLADRARPPRPEPAAEGDAPAPAEAQIEPTAASLRARGAELLRRSADISYEEPTHPAYERILDQLAPDEARILRLLDRGGPQPSVDVRKGGPLGVGSELVAPGLSMIGPEAGCRYCERVPAYLDNLHRLGLIWFSREPLPDPLRYQVLEAQPEVAEALARAGRGRTVRRSIQLTPFGEDFCRVCLPPEADGTGR